MRGGPGGPGLVSWLDASPGRRSGIRSAFGPVGGKVARPEGMFVLGAVGTMEFETEGVDVTGMTGIEDGSGVGCVGFGGGAGLAFDLVSAIGALQTLEPPKAGMEAGGDEARGAYLSLDASARLANKASSLPGSLRGSLADSGSIARDERREYESAWGPSRSDGDAWWDEWGVGPVGVPGICLESGGPALRCVSRVRRLGFAAPAGPIYESYSRGTNLSRSLLS